MQWLVDKENDPHLAQLALALSGTPANRALRQLQHGRAPSQKIRIAERVSLGVEFSLKVGAENSLAGVLA